MRGVTTASDWPVPGSTPPLNNRFHNQQQSDIQTSGDFSLPTITRPEPVPGLAVTGWVSIKNGLPLKHPTVNTQGSLVKIAAELPRLSSQSLECNFYLPSTENTPSEKGDSSEKS